MKDKIDLRNLDIDQLEELIVSIGEKSFRTKQVFTWLSKGVSSFHEMNNIPKTLIEKLEAMAYIGKIKPIAINKSKIDGTRKYLFQLEDGAKIESVYMEYKHGNSLCISSQAGCLMGCKFCASTLEGLLRNLTPSEMINQLYEVEKDTGNKISNIVVMGTGEPFNNYDNLSVYLRNINSQLGINMGYRHITVSTCGLVPEIKRFSKDFPQVNLAISLHGGEDQLRSSIMPVNNKYKLSELIDTCKEYIETTHRRITFEYILIDDVNDSKEDIEILAKLLKGINCHVNFIPFNNIEEKAMVATGRKKAMEHVKYLENMGIQATLRRELGDDINGACGQLRLQSS